MATIGGGSPSRGYSKYGHGGGGGGRGALWVDGGCGVDRGWIGRGRGGWK